MAALSKALAEGLDVTLDTRVIGVTARGAGWEITTEAGKVHATHVILTVPSPQLLPILSAPRIRPLQRLQRRSCCPA